MLQAIFHAWERQLASVTKDRVVRPFDWGLDWIGAGGRPGEAPADVLAGWVSRVMADTDAFFTPPQISEYSLSAPLPDGDRVLTFPSAFATPHPENDRVHCRYVPAREAAAGGRRAAVLVLPQWNADAGGHVGLCRLLAWNGMTALRLSLPYHDARMPAELHRADYIVSANLARTVQVCRQAVLDARRAIAWLHAEGFERIGILGTSLGSCLSLLTTAHEPLIRAQALNHISPDFADVVWRGISTRHVREGLDGHIELDRLRALWRPISPRWYLERLHDRQTLLVYARYDLTFPVDLSRELVRLFREAAIPHELATLGCGHYSSGKAPFKFVDGWILVRFLRRALLQRTS
ncbi:MAG: abhydrolase domain-containing 18 [Acidobacteria bacterium]|nr:abhydrolase domain-containing 18 [Acidobacteriota bacterium]